MEERIDFVCLTLVDRRGRLLMQERDEHAPVWPDAWCFPGGGREPGETPREGAVRELAEETGVVVDPASLEDLGEFVVESPHGRFRYHAFVAATDLGDDDVECHEGRQMVFVDPADLDGLDVTRSTRTVLGSLYTWIDARPDLPSPRLRCFAGVVLVDRRGWILLQERDEHPRIDPDRWGLAGGHLDAGESFADGARRELEEETGLVVDDLELWREFNVDHTAPYGTWDRMQVFVAACDLADDDVDCREGRQIVFVDPAVVPTLPLTSAAGDILPAFLSSQTYARLAGGSR